MKLLHNPTLITTLSLLLLTLTCLPFPSRSDSDRCRASCGTVPVHYPFGIDDGCGAPQFRHMFTCNTSSLSLFFITTNGNYKVQSIDYKAQTVTVYDPDMSTCTILQPHHDLVLSDIQYAVIPPSPDTIFALLNCSLDSPLLHRFRSLCFDLPGHRCQDLYSSCNSFRIFTSGIGGPSISYGTPGALGNNNTAPGLAYGQPGLGGQPGAPDNVSLKNSTTKGLMDNSGPGLGSTGGQSSYYGAPNSFNQPGFGNTGGQSSYYGPPGSSNQPSFGNTGGQSSYYGPPNNFPINNSPPPGLGDTGVPSGNYYGTPGLPNNSPIINNNPPPGLGDTGVPSGNYYYGTPGVPSGTGGGGASTSMPPPPCCFTGYSTMKVMRMDILDCTHFTSFYNVDKLKGVGPMEWSYGLKFSYSVPDMGCDRCRKSGGSCGFDVETEALLCLCSNTNNSTRQCGTDDLNAGERWAPLTMFQACIIGLGVFFFLLSDSCILSAFV